LLGSYGQVELGLLAATLAGISLVIASACVFNNYVDRDIDRAMSRTKNRALAKGLIPAQQALIFASVIGILGFVLLLKYTNLLTAGIGLVGFVDYVVLYGISKRRSVHGTIIGSISGATPVVAGYTAATNRFDAGALILFLILVFWQMPHFFAIAMYRFDDYKAAKLPVLPVKRGTRATKIQILLYIFAFIIACAMLTVLGYTGYAYLIVMTIVGLGWLGVGLKGFTTVDDKRWARSMFHISLVVLLVFSFLISINE